MAERRMFTKKITESDMFLDMPLSAQTLYFHLMMNADDDGFVNNPKTVKRIIGASDDDMMILLAKRFLIDFDTGVIVITHWRMHNYIQSDRYKETVYTEEKSMLSLDDKKAYFLDTEGMDTKCIQNVSIMDTQVRLGKDSKGKDSIEIVEDSIEEGESKPKKTAKAVTHTYYPDDEELDNCFKEYIKMRKKIKAPMTDLAITMAKNKLDKLAPYDDELKKDIIKQSIFYSWKGLFPIHEEYLQEIGRQPKKESGLSETLRMIKELEDAGD